LSGPEVGSVWRERDNRFERYVRVVGKAYGATADAYVPIQTCDATGKGLTHRVTRAKLTAFGKRYKPHSGRTD
jgi:hypothetical protein